MTTLNPSNADLLAEVMATPGGERVGTCYQCGTCSGSCPIATAMDYPPASLRSLAIAREGPVLENLVTLRDTVSTHYNISGDDNDTRLNGNGVRYGHATST